MFKGSKNVEPEGHPSCISSVGGQSNAYTNEDATVFWETVPAQYLPLVLWLEADRMASLRIDEDVVQDRARGRQGRAADARREPAVRPAERDHLRPGVHGAPLQAPDDRQHEGSRGGVDRRRARLLPHLLRAEQRDAGAGRRLRHEGGAGAGHAVSRPRAEVRPAGAARHPEGAAADEGAARHARGELAAAGGRRRATTSPSTAIPTRIRCTSRRRCCPTARARASTASWSTRSSIALAAFGGGNIIEDPNLFYAVAIVQPGHTPEEAIDALIAELDRLRNEPITRGASCSRRRTSSRATTSSAASRTRTRRRSSATPSSSTTTSRPPTASSTSS